MISKTEIESLVFLLDQPAPFVQSEVRNRLFELGDQAVPLLDQHKSEIAHPQYQDLITEVLRWITYSSVAQHFTEPLAHGRTTLKPLQAADSILAHFE